METWKVQPQSELLSQFIDCYWFLEQSLDDSMPPQPKLIANPAMHLIFCPEDQAYHYSQSDKQVTGFGCHLLHPSSKSTQIQHPATFRLVGVKFKPGASFALTSLLPLVTLNKVEVFEFDVLNQRVQSALHSESISRDSLVPLLETLLLPFCEQAIVNKTYQLSQQCLNLLDANHSIQQLNDNFECSLRTLERTFVKVMGMTLQQYQTMQRLEALIIYLYQHKDEKVSWVQVAADFEFSDQPHLIRYLKHQIGLSPNNYVNQRNLTIDTYGDFENH